MSLQESLLVLRDLHRLHPSKRQKDESNYLIKKQLEFIISCIRPEYVNILYDGHTPLYYAFVEIDLIRNENPDLYLKMFTKIAKHTTDEHVRIVFTSIMYKFEKSEHGIIPGKNSPLYKSAVILYNELKKRNCSTHLSRHLPHLEEIDQVYMYFLQIN